MLMFDLRDKVHSGMAGLLIVDDDPSELPEELEAVSCPNHCDKDVQMVFQPVLQMKNTTGRPNRGFVYLQSVIKDSDLFR